MPLKHNLRRMFLKLTDLRVLRARQFSDHTVMLPKVPRVEISQSEPWMFNLLKLLVDHFGGGLLDVGVNLGQTLSAYKLIDPGGAYLGLEPNPDCVAYAHQLIEANGFEKVTIVPSALAAEAGLLKLDFYQPLGHDSSASIIPEFRADQEVYQTMVIASVTGAQLQGAFDLGAFNIVKVDVEGAESLVLSELTPVLESARPFVVAEILPPYTQDNTKRISAQTSVEALLQASGYAIYRLVRDEKTLFGFEKCEGFGVHSDLLKSDYVFVPREKVEVFEAHTKKAALVIKPNSPA